MKISVIVCTRNRARAIVQCLDSIAQSLLAAAPVDAEIVVVDNGSTDDTPQAIKIWAETCAFPVRCLQEPKKGVSAARNCGIRAAKGDLLVFTDDDCRLSEGHITDALRHDAADTAPVLRGGKVELGDPADLPMTIQAYPHMRYWHRPEHAGKHVHLGGGMIVGCNMAVRRDLAAKIGFFDECIGPGTSVPAGEDTDYVLRAYMKDIRIEYVPDMTVYHFHGRKTAEDARKLLGNYVQGTGALYAKHLFNHPNLRGKFTRKGHETKAGFTEGTDLNRVDLSRNEKLANAVLGALKYIGASMKRAAS